jgi:peptidoglycan/xylan/chitin deacetylase (PgdA/CDA1 family)
MRFGERAGVLTLAATLLSIPASASHPNLIVNPSVETPSADPSMPLGWRPAGWGDNAAVHEYRSRGAKDGRRSLLVGITRYVNGDRKWASAPAVVTPDRRYVYCDYYRSNIPSTIGVQSEDAAGNLSHQFLGDAPPSKRWRQAVFSFITPANAVRVTVFHVIAGVGYLETDLFYLGVAETPVASNGVPNASLEQASDVTNWPLGWQTGNWGTNSPVFTYLQSGRTGRRSVQTEITSHSSGDAKWYFDPQPVSGGQSYRFSDWYKANLPTQVGVMLVRQDGSVYYVGLPPAEPSRQWAPYSCKFLMPADAVQASVFHVVAGVGRLITDDHSLVPAPTVGFNRALVSLAFDDAWKSIHEQALPLLRRYRAVSTQYVLTSPIDTDSEYMSAAELRDLAREGHQIACHGFSHRDLTTLSAAGIEYELGVSKRFLESHGLGPILDWASPYGGFNSTTTAAVKRCYRSQRSVQAGFNSKDDFDLYALRVQNVVLATKAEEVQAWVDQASREKTWLILVYHEVDVNDRPYSTAPAQLERHLQIITGAGVPIVTVDQALGEVLAQF